MPGEADHLVAGLDLPAIGLAATTGGTITLSSLAGRHVLYCYPWTGRPGVPNPPRWDEIPGAHGSTPEAEGFRACHAAFAARGIGILGLSSQSSAWQHELGERLRLPFPLLSDHELLVQQALRLPTFETGGVNYLKRLTLVVADGRIVGLYFPVADPAGHAAEVLADLA